ncbi:MAG: TetR/AcrR family transcriptional regulator [Acidimicrobiia bacterium]
MRGATTSTPIDHSGRRPGRPRDARAGEAIMRAAVDVLAEHGPGGFTVDEVAARAGCGKATVYRRWRSRAELLLDTAHHLGIQLDDPDTGSLRDDLVVLMRGLTTKLRDTPAGRIMPAIIAEAAVNPEMREVLTQFMRERRRTGRVAVTRGIDRGELPQGTDPELVLDLVGGPVFYRLLVSGEPVDDRLIETVVDAGLAGVRHRAGRSASGRSARSGSVRGARPGSGRRGGSV